MLGGDRVLHVEQPIVDTAGAVEPHGMVEARRDQSGLCPAEPQHAQDRLEDRVVADVRERGEVALRIREPVDRTQRVERLDPDRLLGNACAFDFEVHRARHVTHVKAAAARPVGLGLLGQCAAGYAA